MRDPSAAPQDFFGPVTKDPKCMKLEKNVTVAFVDSEAKVTDMEQALMDSDFIGMDAEWRPSISRKDAERPALFQIGNRKAAFLIDLVVLANNAVLDRVLTALFTNDKTVCIGFSFKSDLSVFKRAFKEMKFFQNFAHFVDVQDEFGRLNPEKKGVGLAKVVDELFKQIVCKNE